MKNQTKNKLKHIQENYDRIYFVVRKGKKEIIKKQAELKGKSINKYIEDLIDKEINK